MNPENIVISPASSNDIGDIQLLFRKMFEIYHVDQNIEYPYTDSRISYLKHCVQDQIALVAKANEVTVGFITGGVEDTLLFKTYRQHGHIHNLFVLEEYRRQGIGKSLIQQFIQRCKESDVHRIITDSDDIETLRHFYASIGFLVTSVNYELDTSNRV